MPVRSNLKDKLEDDVLDLSVMQLESIPVKEIAPLTKGTTLDLSNNLLTSVPDNFSILTHLIKLDLSKNQIVELPEYFGNLKSLRHLDLYSNQLERLPVSFAQLKNLKWLDLKNNPLVPALRQAAGPCITNSECTTCAKKVVSLLQSLQSQLEHKKKLWVLEEKKNMQRRLESEEAEKERARAEKKAAKGKRREESKMKDNEGKKMNKKCPNSSSNSDNASHFDTHQREGLTIQHLIDDHRRKKSSSNWCWTFMMTLLSIMFVLGASGASILWIYTEGNLSQKSIQKAIPIIRRDVESTFYFALNKSQTYGSYVANYISVAMGGGVDKLKWGWKEFLRRNDVLAQYVNLNLGPYFCSFKKSFYLKSQSCYNYLVHFMSNVLKSWVANLHKTVWSYLGQIVDFIMGKSKALVSFLDGSTK
ncbi:uncharacterized protein [Lepeophtheirus salmonis]|nr:leucine-rich repeat-containing protein 59-like [Lepeophtheirus salmonis]